MSLGFRHVVLLACLLAATACSTSTRTVEQDGTAIPSSTGPDASATATADDDDQQDPGTAATERPRAKRPADGSPIVLTGRALCADVPAATTAAALGLRVEQTLAGDTATPQCTYAYRNPDGEDSTATVAAVRPADVDGRKGLAAFDYMVELSRGLAGPSDLEQVDLPVGDKAVRVSGGGVHTGVVASGGHLLVVTVPSRDASADAVDALVGEVARALA